MDLEIRTCMKIMFVLVSSAVSMAAEMAKVQVEQGWLEGEQLELVTKDGSYFSFKGIPYAAPPLGKLRFKSPQPPVSWPGVRKATEHGPTCPQVISYTDEWIPGDEDCLFLNVYTSDLKPQRLSPVMVFIHGGGYKCGNGNVSMYGPDFLVQHGVVLVTINYRLEVLGFLCLDTEEVPGNAGLKDQVAALKWVNKNIVNFGGDPNNVTVFGQSAGSSSIALHIMSPMSKGLFKRAILMSGVPFCDWSIPFEPQRRAFLLGQELGCRTDDPKILLQFLRSLPVEKLVNIRTAVLAFESVEIQGKMYQFTPVVEKYFGNENFLTEEPENYLKKGYINEVDVMIGHTDQENIYCVPFISQYYETFSKYAEFIVPRDLILRCTSTKILKLSDTIRQHYFGDKQFSSQTDKELIAYLSESIFCFQIQRFLKMLPTFCESRRYFYRFSGRSERNILGIQGAEYGIIGASHSDDLFYLFDPKRTKIPIDKSSKSYKMILQICQLYTNFAKCGNPTPDRSLGVTWPEYEGATERYLDIGERLTVGENLNDDVMAFWQNIYDEAAK